MKNQEKIQIFSKSVFSAYRNEIYGKIMWDIHNTTQHMGYLSPAVTRKTPGLRYGKPGACFEIVSGLVAFVIEDQILDLDIDGFADTVHAGNDIATVISRKIKHNGSNLAEVINSADVVNDMAVDVLQDLLGVVIAKRLLLQVDFDVCGSDIVLCACGKGIQHICRVFGVLAVFRNASYEGAGGGGIVAILRLGHSGHGKNADLDLSQGAALGNRSKA